jgi:VWFA-related protein
MVAVDMSGSMIDAMPEVRRSVKRFLTALRPQDQVTLMAFNDNLVTLARPSVDLAARLKSVDRLAGWGGTALYDVIVRSMDTLGKKTGRRALVVFSDGEDQSSHIPLATAERRVEASDAVVYTVGQGRGTRVPSLKQILERLAKVSGGRAFFTESTDKLDDAFSEIIEELANQYLFGYAPPNPARDGTWRRITVKTTDERLKVRVRQGYLR